VENGISYYQRHSLSDSPRSCLLLVQFGPVVILHRKSANMNPFDANRWYQINSPLFPKRSLVGLQPHDPDSTAKVFFKLTNESLPGRQWQLFPTDTNTYILRSKLSGPDAYLALRQDDDAAGAKPRSIAATRNVDTASSDVLWKITNFPNGHYKLVNVANGTGWHLRAEDRQNLSMTNNIGEQDNQKFDFTAVGQTIDNATFSSIRVRFSWISHLAALK
jgi:hypothetical protein